MKHNKKYEQYPYMINPMYMMYPCQMMNPMYYMMNPMCPWYMMQMMNPMYMMGGNLPSLNPLTEGEE